MDNKGKGFPKSIYESHESFDADKIREQFRLLKDNNDPDILRNRLIQAVYLLDNSPMAVFITDLNNVIKWANSGAEYITGYSLEEMYGKNMSLFKSEYQNSKFYEEMWDHITKNGYWQGGIWNRNKKGQLYYQWMRLVQLRNEAGEVTEYAAVALDYSQYNRLQNDSSDYHFFLDNLTGLANQQSFRQDVTETLKISAGTGVRHCLILLNLDRFSDINVLYGFRTGDLLLIEAGNRLRLILGNRGNAYRFGSDTYALWLTDIEDTSIFASLIDEIDIQLSKEYIFEQLSINITVSLGISTFPDDGKTYEELLQGTELALRKAKDEGNHHIQFANQELNVKAIRWLNIGPALKEAIHSDTLEMYYQIQVGNKTKKVVGAEALVRWKHETLGFIAPDEFISYAETTNLMIPLGDWILERVFRDVHHFEQKKMKKIHYSINLSARQIEHPSFIATVKTLMDKYEINPQHIIFEVTERVVVKMLEQTREVFAELKAMGFMLALDDFGKGQSSLSFLMDFPVDVLKIDASFITGVYQDEMKKRLTEAILSLCNEINVLTVVEGVETYEDLAYLSSKTCDVMQGYYFGKPLPRSGFETLLSQKDHLWKLKR